MRLAPRVTAASLVAWLLPAVATVAQDADVLVRRHAEAIEREWWVRAAALAPAEHADALHAALRDDEWRRRAAALDALARAGEEALDVPVELRDTCAAALSDPHPNVRARAFEAAGALGLDLRGVGELPSEPLATVRLELARALGRIPRPNLLWLADLASDEDERVCRAARDAIAGLDQAQLGRRGPHVLTLAQLRAGVFVLLANGADVPTLARYCLALADGGLDESDLDALRARGEELHELARAHVEVLSLARLGSGDAALVVRVWAARPEWEPELARLFGRAARSGSEELARALLRALEEDAAVDDGVRAALVVTLVETLGESAPAFLVRAEPRPAVLAELIRELGLRRDEWDPEVSAPWTAPAAPLEVRRELVGAVSSAYLRVGGGGNARLLVALLDDPDPDVAARAFEVLAEVREPLASTLEPLRRAWDRLEAEEQLARLSWFTRERPLAPFRDEWMRLGEERALRGAACELLAGFAGDGEVVRCLVGWFDGDLERLERTASPTRADEQLLQAELRALVRVDGAEAHWPFLRALQAALGRSTEVGKVAAAALGRSGVGRTFLRELLADGRLADDADRRTRIEACIALAQEGEPAQRERACRTLLVDREGAAWDLRERMLRALSASEVPAARAALAELALAPDLEPVERVRLATLLARHDDDASRDALVALSGAPFDAEVRGLALRALALRGETEALLALLAELALPGPADREETRAFVRGEALVAAVTLTPVPEAVCAGWLHVPLARAEHDLARRFEGRDLPRPGFSSRHELELASRMPSEALTACLAALDGYARIDGRTLLALGEATTVPAARDALLAAGAVALAGEPEPDEADAAWARAQRLGLAWRAGEWERAAVLARRTLDARRAGALSDTRWSKLFGSFDPALGIDPGARVRALEWQARARAALARGATEEARAAAARAEAACGGSRLAREEQAALEEDLDRAAGAGGAR